MAEGVADDVQGQCNRSPIDDEAPPRVAQFPHSLHAPDRLGARGVKPGRERGHTARGGPGEIVELLG